MAVGDTRSRPNHVRELPGYPRCGDTVRLGCGTWLFFHYRGITGVDGPFSGGQHESLGLLFHRYWFWSAVMHSVDHLSHTLRCRG